MFEELINLVLLLTFVTSNDLLELSHALLATLDTTSAKAKETLHKRENLIEWGVFKRMHLCYDEFCFINLILVNDGVVVDVYIFVGLLGVLEIGRAHV